MGAALTTGAGLATATGFGGGAAFGCGTGGTGSGAGGLGSGGAASSGGPGSGARDSAGGTVDWGAVATSPTSSTSDTSIGVWSGFTGACFARMLADSSASTSRCPMTATPSPA